MPLFRCDKCGCVENTALSNTWINIAKNKDVLCSECSTGKWRGRFQKKSADGYYIDDQRFIYHPDTVDPITMEWKYNKNFKMIGRV